MTTSTSVHSNAFNFMSYLQSGVDPRTGQYTVSITLPEVKTNGLRGPTLPLVLSYNPLNVQDSGFGFGWNLQLSQYEPGSQIVSLSSGETFKVQGISGDQLLMPEKKLDSFHFYKLDDVRYRVVHKSGQVENLEVRGSQGNQLALPTRIFAPEGHGVTLEYAPFGTHQMLSKVMDDSGQILLDITRDSTSVRLVVRGAQGADAEFVMILGSSLRSVMRIELPTDNKASWRFAYSQIRGHSCMASVDTPVGGHEDVFYQDSGHQFPVRAGRDPLPRVTRHLITPALVSLRLTCATATGTAGSASVISWGAVLISPGQRMAWITCIDTLAQSCTSIHRLKPCGSMARTSVTSSACSISFTCWSGKPRASNSISCRWTPTITSMRDSLFTHSPLIVNCPKRSGPHGGCPRMAVCRVLRPSAVGMIATATCWFRLRPTVWSRTVSGIRPAVKTAARQTPTALSAP